MNQAPPPRPFDAIYRAFPDAKHPDVARIITSMASQGRSVTVLRVREAIDTPAAAQSPTLPPRDVRPEPSEMATMARVSQAVAYRKPDRLAERLARCVGHAGLTDAEEEYAVAMHRRFPDWGYLPAANRYEQS